MSGVLPSLVALAVGYAIGSIPFGYLLCRVRTGRDLRQSGSGNVGATNVARALGVPAGLLVLALDAGKGVLAVAAGQLVGGRAAASLGGIGAVLGHVFCPWLGFGGGKGVATGLGVLGSIAPRESAIAAAAFLVVVLATRWVSLGSLVAAATVVIAIAARGEASSDLATAVAVAGLVMLRHRDNVKRLLLGTEPRFGSRAEGTR